MEQLISEIEAYADSVGVKPSTVLQRAAGYGGTVWSKWKSGKASCTMPVAKKIRDHIHKNSPSSKPALTAASVEGSLPTKKRKDAQKAFQGSAPKKVKAVGA